MNLLAIWAQVPPDYFSKGTRTNILQKLWHNGKFFAVLSLVKQKSSHTILDVGSADGSFIYRISRHAPCKNVIATDPYFPPLSYGKTKFRNMPFLQSDAHKLPFKSHSIDTITILETLEHVADPYGVLLELKRILKPHGQLIVELDSGNLLFQIVWFVWRKFGKGRVWEGAHLTHFNINLLEKLFSKTHFKISSKKLFNIGMGVCYRLVIQQTTRTRRGFRARRAAN